MNAPISHQSFFSWFITTQEAPPFLLSATNHIFLACITSNDKILSWAIKLAKQKLRSFTPVTENRFTKRRDMSSERDFYEWIAVAEVTSQSARTYKYIYTHTGLFVLSHGRCWFRSRSVCSALTSARIRNQFSPPDSSTVFQSEQVINFFFLSSRCKIIKEYKIWMEKWLNCEWSIWFMKSSGNLIFLLNCKEIPVE